MTDRRGPADGSSTDPAAPGGTAEPLGAVLDDIDPSRHQMTAVPGGRVRCESCGATVEAGAADVVGTRRLEGASDPADMSMVHGLRCPSCGVVGALVTRYGPEASEVEADVLVALPRGSDRGMAPGSTASPADRSSSER